MSHRVSVGGPYLGLRRSRLKGLQDISGPPKGDTNVAASVLVHVVVLKSLHNSSVECFNQ